MISIIAALVTSQSGPDRGIGIGPLGNNMFELQLVQRGQRLEPAKLSPKKFGDNQWEFDWLTSGKGVENDPNQLRLKVRVYSQERKEVADKALAVARMAMQIWDRAYHRLKVDSPTESGVVDFYLCFGGKAGGEQRFDEEIVPGLSRTAHVNTIYIYRLDTFKEPVEMAREVAHEYGHAILPAVGGFKEPEAWSNGYLGEKLFLKWIKKDMVAGRLGPDDAMGATIQELGAWLASNVDPLVQQAAYQYPETNLIGDSRNGMDSFLGLAMYTEALCPPSVFVRSLAYVADAHKDQSVPNDYGQFILQAASEVEALTLSVPQSIFDSKKPIWIPLGKGSLQGATILSRKNGWAKVAPLVGNIVIQNPPIG